MTEPPKDAAPQPCHFLNAVEFRRVDVVAMCDALRDVARRTTRERWPGTTGSRRCPALLRLRRRRPDRSARGVTGDAASSSRMIADLVTLLRRAADVDPELVVLDRELVFDLAQVLLELSSSYAHIGASLESFAVEGIEGRLLEALVDPSSATP